MPCLCKSSLAPNRVKALNYFSFFVQKNFLHVLPTASPAATAINISLFFRQRLNDVMFGDEYKATTTQQRKYYFDVVERKGILKERNIK